MRAFTEFIMSTIYIIVYYGMYVLIWMSSFGLFEKWGLSFLWLVFGWFITLMIMLPLGLLWGE